MVQASSFLAVCVFFCCTISLAFATLSEDSHSPEATSPTVSRHEGQAIASDAALPFQTSSEADDPTHQESGLQDTLSVRNSVYVYNGVLSNVAWECILTRAQLDYLMQRTVRWYVGPSQGGVSSSRMRYLFQTRLLSNVQRLISKKKGGIIEEFGAFDKRQTYKCSKRPTLTVDDVRQVARMSFDIRNFQVSFPPCNGGGEWVNCHYSGGKCCKRPQAEFIARYYDTAVAAMALGATHDEAFAPLVHARLLGYALMSCDPTLSLKKLSLYNMATYVVREGNRVKKEHLTGWGTSLISFPTSYEVLYELYNTMLIERIRSRRRVHIPNHTQMKRLNEKLYYKKLAACLTPLDRDLDRALTFPGIQDFNYAGLQMATSSRLATLGRILGTDSAVGNSSDSGLHPALRFSDARFYVYATYSRKWELLDNAKCNTHKSGQPFYPYRFSERVWSKFEGCCATECRFMALYGRTFSARSANCCAGCNRYRCNANNYNIAAHLAKVTTIEVPNKVNSGPEKMTMTV